MHPRNRYRTNPVDLASLALQHPELNRFLKKNEENDQVTFDPKEPGAVLEIVKAMLKVDIGVRSWEGIPDGYLVPSVTRSLNYLHFIEDLLQEAQDHHIVLREGKFVCVVTSVQQEAVNDDDEYDQGKEDYRLNDQEIKGLDVGIGASGIFPLLGCALHPNWTFVGIDIDPTALEFAKKNAAMNFPPGRIEVRENPPSPVPQIVRSLQSSNECFHFVMCNPPFFSTPSTEDVYRPFGGTSRERYCENGEVGFVSGLIDESIKLSKNVIWYTSMIGMKESMRSLLKKLHHESKAETIRVFRLDQGNKQRWVIAWSFFPQLSPRAIRGNTLAITNLNESSTIDERTQEALSQLRGFSSDTGICAGPGYRFRIRILTEESNTVRIDLLDLKGLEAESRAISCRKKLEQLLLKQSRRWRKIEQSRTKRARREKE